MIQRVAVVTGGTRGLGAAIAGRLTRDGFRVVVVHRDPEARRGGTSAGGSVARRVDVPKEGTT